MSIIVNYCQFMSIYVNLCRLMGGGGGGGCHAPARPYAPVSKPGLLDEGRVPRGVQGRAGA